MYTTSLLCVCTHICIIHLNTYILYTCMCTCVYIHTYVRIRTCACRCIQCHVFVCAMYSELSLICHNCFGEILFDVVNFVDLLQDVSYHLSCNLYVLHTSSRNNLQEFLVVRSTLEHFTAIVHALHQQLLDTWQIAEA